MSTTEAPDQAAITAPGLARLSIPASSGVPPWLVARRADAARWIEHHGFPTRRDEDWRYLDLTTPLALPYERGHDGAPAGDRDEADAPAAADLVSAAGADLVGPRLVFVNGRLAPRLSRGGEGPDQLRVGSVAAALAERPDEVEAAITARRPGWYHAFDALNDALAADGAFIEVPEGTRLEAPVQLVFVSLPGAAPRLASPRSVILAGEHSKLSLVVHHLGVSGEPVWTNAVTTVVCAEAAEVDYTEVQDAPLTAYHLSLLDVHQAADSRFSASIASLGGLVARHEVRVALAGRDAEAILNGLYLPAGQQHHDHPVMVDHAVGGARSRQLYKGVVGGAAHGVFNGRILVRQAAAGTDAAQTNKNLLLSDRAEVDTRPRLEIHADDVRCAHGAAVGQLDPDALYYLRSRGIPRADAERILVAAFVREVIDRIPYGSLRARLEARMAEQCASREEVPRR